MTAVIGSLAVGLGFITAVLGLLNQRRIRRTAGAVQNISVQINGQLSKLLERETQLLDALHESGVPIPPAADVSPPDSGAAPAAAPES